MRLLLSLLFCASAFSASQWIEIPDYGDPHWRAPVANVGALPAAGNYTGDARVLNSTQAIYVWSGSAWVTASGGGSGTVTSVGLRTDSTTSSVFANATNAITGSPVTTSGNFTLTLSNQSANVCLAGPASGGAAAPTFRALVGADLPLPAVATKGGVFSKAAVTSNFLTSISSADGSIGQAQPAFTDISGSVAASQLPNPSASTLGGVRSIAAVSNNFLTSISTSGVPTQAQPSFSGISGTASLTSQVTGVLPVANGGTNASSLAGHGAVVMNSGGTAQTVVAPGSSGNVLTSDGTDWASTAPAASGVSTVGTFSGSSQTNGAAISGSTITFGPADGTNPGMVAASGAQTLAPTFTFSATGAASTAALKFTGTPYAAGSATTSKPLLWMENGTPTNAWNSSGTWIGINAASTQNFVDFQVNAVSNFSISSIGTVSVGKNIVGLNTNQMDIKNGGGSTNAGLFRFYGSGLALTGIADDIMDNTGNTYWFGGWNGHYTQPFIRGYIGTEGLMTGVGVQGSSPVAPDGPLDVRSGISTKLLTVTSSIINFYKHLKSLGTAPTTTVNANAGTGATCALTHATDTTGVITIVAGAAVLSLGDQCDVTFNAAYAVAPICVMWPNTSVTALAIATVGQYVTSSTTQMTVNAGAALTATLTYSWNYLCTEPNS